MREWCSCGAAIRARRSDVKEWREQHRCPDRPERHDSQTFTDTERPYQEWSISLRHHSDAPNV